jgi:hypothetical protein
MSPPGRVLGHYGKQHRQGADLENMQTANVLQLLKTKSFATSSLAVEADEATPPQHLLA